MRKVLLNRLLNMYSKRHVFNWMMGTNLRSLLVTHVLLSITHIKDVHTKPSPRDLHCTYCDKCTFKNIRVRREHERYCSKNPNNKKVNCLFCGATFSNYGKLKGYMIKDHNVGK